MRQFLVLFQLSEYEWQRNYQVSLSKYVIHQIIQEFYPNRSLKLDYCAALIFTSNHEKLKIDDLRYPLLESCKDSYASEFQDRFHYGMEKVISGLEIKNIIWEFEPLVFEVSIDCLIDNYQIDRNVINYMKEKIDFR